MTRSSVDSGVIPPALPSVHDVAFGLISRFEQVFRRPMVNISNAEAVVEEVVELHAMCAAAEEQAKRVNVESGGWRDEPDTSAKM